MMNWIALMFWGGGVAASYSFFRHSGKGRVESGLDALFWPWGLGAVIAHTAFSKSEGED